MSARRYLMVASPLVLFLGPISSHAEEDAAPLPAIELSADAATPVPSGQTAPGPTASPPRPAASPPAGPGKAPAPDASRLFLSRMDAIAMALRKNIDLKGEVLNTSMSKTDIARSKGIYNPAFTLSGNGGVSAMTGDPFFRTRSANATIGLTQPLPTGGNVGITAQAGYTTAEFLGAPSATDWQTAAGLTLSQPLLKNFGKQVTELSITLASSSYQDSLERFRFVTTDAVVSVITQYNHLYALRQMELSKAMVLDSARRFLEEIKKKPPGPTQPMEITNAEFAITQRQKDLVDAERNVSDQEATLRYLIGHEAKVHIIPTDPPSSEEPQETEVQAVNAALANRSDLKQLHISLKTSELQERVARHQTLPDLTVSGGGGFTAFAETNGDAFRQLVQHPGTYWSATMQFNYPLGNAAARNDYLKSRIRTEQVRYQIKALEWRIRNDVEADLRALISARLQLHTTEKALHVAEQRLDEYRKNNARGAATVQDVINAENDLTYARNSHTDATEMFANGVTKLWRDTGELLDRQAIHIDTYHPEKMMEENKPAAAR